MSAGYQVLQCKTLGCTGVVKYHLTVGTGYCCEECSFSMFARQQPQKLTQPEDVAYKLELAYATIRRIEDYIKMYLQDEEWEDLVNLVEDSKVGTNFTE